MKNNLKKSLWVTLLILAVLLILHFIPPVRLGNITLRRVDLLSDLRGKVNVSAPDRNHAVKDSAYLSISGDDAREEYDVNAASENYYRAQYQEDTAAVAEHQKAEEDAYNAVAATIATADTTTAEGKEAIALAQTNLDSAQVALSRAKAKLADTQAKRARHRAKLAEEFGQANTNSSASADVQTESAYSNMEEIKTYKIIDYGAGTPSGMGSFYAALSNSGNKPVRIAVFGDSFIEADILTVNLREMFQKKYGGCGVGFVNINASADAPRPTIRQKSEGFTDHSAMDLKGYDRTKLGISGHYTEPEDGAYVILRGQKKFAARLDTCNRSTIYFTSKYGASITAKINNAVEQTFKVPASAAMQTLQVEGHIGSVKWTINQSNNSVVYGVAMDGIRGISVDNFSLRGNSGTRIHAIPYRTLSAFNSARHYDLIILEYGLNVASPGAKNYVWYEAGFLKTLAYLKKCFPNTSILLLGVSDRDQRMDDGSIHTMHGIKMLISSQNRIAQKSGVAFWNTFQAMGGEDSMAQMVDTNPPMANLDYTHINYRGGKKIAKLLFNALMTEK